jgi:diguanylate cyclase (GGDEF)-like protein
MAAALLVARPVPGSRSRTLSLWIASLAVYVLPGFMMMGVELAGGTGAPAPTDPFAVGVLQDLVRSFLIASFALQSTALHEVARSFRSRGSIAAAICLSCVFALLVPRLLPGTDVLAIAHVLLPLICWRPLRQLAVHGIGGAAIASAVVVGALPSCAELVGLHKLRPGTMTLWDLLTLFASSLGLLLWHQHNIERLLERLATTDALTGALNRHGLLPRLDIELARARRVQRPLTVVICDLDHFKRVNDQFGHQVGDAVLQAFVARARAFLRAGDLIGRLGGEEFVLVLLETLPHEAVRVMERIRATPLDVGAAVPQVTFSAGVVTALTGHDEDSLALLKHADDRLYRAKQTRDCIVADDATLEP